MTSLLVLVLVWQAAGAGVAPPAGSDPVDAARALEQRIQAVHAVAMETTVAVYGRGRGGRPRGSGASGVMVSADGLVLTAAHVLESVGERPIVRMPDGRLLDAVSLGRDDRTDFGLLRLVAEGDYRYAELGISSALLRDEVCLMYGHPGGVEEGRPAVLRLGTFLGIRAVGFLRTTCKMMPGDSGGPLFDLDGRVVGVNSKINVALDRNYHVPVDPAREQWQRLLAGEQWDGGAARGRGAGRRRDTVPPRGSGAEFLAGGVESLRGVSSAAAARLAESVVKLDCGTGDDALASLGVVVAADGGILAKSSRLPEDTVRCGFADGREWAGAVTARDLQTDLAWVQVDAQDLVEVALAPGDGLAPGSLLATVGAGGVALHCGTMGAPQRAIPKRAWGVLGVRLDRVEDDDRIEIEAAFPDAPAYLAGLREGELVVEFDGRPFTSGAALRAELRETLPGQRVSLKVLDTAGEARIVEFELGSSDQPSLAGASAARTHAAYQTEISRRRGGFPRAIRHDMPLALDECGAPVVDLAGRVVAINIARHDRTGSLALPQEVVVSAMERLRATNAN